MPLDPSTRVAVGRAVSDLRRTLGWTQRELASRIGVSQAYISKLENGRRKNLTFEGVERVLAAMGARLVVSIDAPYLGDRVRQREPAHSRCSAHVASALRRAGWQVATEVEIGGDRSRGWIDVLAFHPASGLLVVIEIKTEIHDLGAIERSLNWYEREAWAAARRLGWRPRYVVGSLLLLATEANDQRVRANSGPIDAGYPLRARDLAELVANGGHRKPVGRAIAMIDPSSKRQAWLRPLRIDGRRTSSPYVDYADFMRAPRNRCRAVRDLARRARA